MKYLSIFIIVLCLGCKDDDHLDPNIDDKNWVLTPNTALTIGFNDTAFLFNKIHRDSINTVSRPYLNRIAYYVDENNKKIYDEYTILTPVINQRGEIPKFPFYSLNLGGTQTRFAQLSIGGKTWYIDWPNGQTDTLFANYQSDKKGPNECNCSEPLVELTLNGKPFIEKTDYSNNGVYVFE